MENEPQGNAGATTGRQAILFDLDGTLIDTTDLIVYCFNHAWQTVFARTHSRDAFVATMGIPLKDAMRRLLGGLDGLGPDAIDEEPTLGLIEDLLREYRSCNAANHDRMARPFQGMEAVLPKLRSQGYALGVVTSKSRELALRGLQLCSLWEFMEVFVSMEDTVRHKPNPEPLHFALEKLGIAPQQAVYVGDSRHDMQAGRAAGMRTVAALWGPVPREELELEYPDALAVGPEQLLEIFQTGWSAKRSNAGTGCPPAQA
ncbi:MAG: HAD-IA family hydrolase [Acidobacteria bacterium]|nr:HAD-IA family hydrolase [Acidobacteriota bacterium]MCI0717716.1 HAD-IA family hydrolase [Acidobacteriota bacterium]